MNRRAARVLMFDEQDRVLLFRGVDSTTPEVDAWWFSPGGGLEPGETPRDAALREVQEETGLTLNSVAGPVHQRAAEFTFEGTLINQTEQYFVAHVPNFVISAQGWTDLEKRTMLESRWWSLDELENTKETIYPEVLAELVRVELQREPRS